MKVLITGSNGFMGSKLMWFLQEKGMEVHGIDRNPVCIEKKHPNTILGDIRYPEQMDKCPAADLIIHCAASKHDFGISKEEYYSHNEHGTRVLMDFATRRGIDSVIYYSTVSVYGHQDVPCDESFSFDPNTVYGSSKLAGEFVINDWLAADNTRMAVYLRPTVIYGDHNYANMYNLFNTLHKYPWLSIGHGEHIKSIVARTNLVDMTWFVMQNLKPGVQVYNCTDEPQIILRELMLMIASTPGFRMPRVEIPLERALIIGRGFDFLGRILHRDLPVNSDRLKKLCTSTHYLSRKIREAGYVQQHSIEEEIRKMARWYMQEGRFGKAQPGA